MKRKLVDHLVNRGIVSRKNVQRCVLRANMNEGSVVDEMTDCLDVDEKSLAQAMAEFWGFQCWDKSSFDVSSEQLDAVSVDEAREFGALPVDGQDDDVLRLAVYDVDKARPIVEKVRSRSGLAPTVVVAPRTVVEQEVERHYQQSSSGNSSQRTKTPVRNESSGHGVVTKKRRQTTKPGDAVPPTAAMDVDSAPPTRQVDLAADNPFMDLVQKTSANEGESEAAAPVPEQVVAEKEEDNQEEAVDFFDDFQDDEAFEQMVEDSWSSSVAEEEDEGSIGDVDEALEEFDAELDSDLDDDEPSPLSNSASVNWGEYDGESPPRPAGRTGRGRTHSESGIFPVRRSQSNLFRMPDEPNDDQLTLAEVVERQRTLIEKLEREISYQKGILQTMAELLVEARVLSKRKLKARLKAFKEEQRKKYD